MIDEFIADLCGKSLRSGTDLHSFARRRKIEATILHGYRREMIGHCRALRWSLLAYRDLSGRKFDPFAVFVRTKVLVANRRFGNDGSICIFHEEIQTKSSVSLCMELCD